MAFRSAGLVVLDETDKMPGADSKEAGAIELATVRTKSFEPFAKRIYCSTPTTEDGPIWGLFLQGTQESRSI